MIAVILFVTSIFIIFGFYRVNTIYFFTALLFISILHIHNVYLIYTGFYRFSAPSEQDQLIFSLGMFFLVMVVYFFGFDKKVSRAIIKIPKLVRLEIPIIFLASLTAIFIVLFFAVRDINFFVNGNIDIRTNAVNPLFEYTGIATLALASSAKKNNALIVGIIFIFLFIFFLSGKRLSAIPLLLILPGVLKIASVTKLSALSIAALLFLTLNVIGMLRLGIEIDSSNLLFMTYEGVIDNTFIGVIESGYLLINYFSVDWIYPKFVNFFIWSTYPFPLFLLPPSVGFEQILEITNRFPGGGTLVHFSILSNGLTSVFVLILWTYLSIISLKIKLSWIESLVFWSCFISIPRFLLYNPAISFKYIFIIILLMLTSILLRKNYPRNGK